MRFYDVLQLDPVVIKKMIREREEKKDKLWLWGAIIIRSLLIVLFAVVFISVLTALFGSANSPMAVAVFCILLAVRFVDFGYCIRDSLVNLGIVFLILLIAPVLGSLAPPVFSLLIHFVSFLTILVITSDKPEMGNGGLFGFAYVFLSGNVVTGQELLQRFLMMCTGLLICGFIFWMKHKDKNRDVRFLDKLREFSLNTQKNSWQVRYALGVGLILTIGLIFNIERYMWSGFACASLLSDYGEPCRIKEKFLHRLVGVVLGSTMFCLIYSVLPEQMHFLIGPAGGFCLGFATEYKYKTAINCFGALMIAVGIYGLSGAVFLRITDTIIGILVALAFVYFYEGLIGVKRKGVCCGS